MAWGDSSTDLSSLYNVTPNLDQDEIARRIAQRSLQLNQFRTPDFNPAQNAPQVSAVPPLGGSQSAQSQPVAMAAPPLTASQPSQPATPAAAPPLKQPLTERYQQFLQAPQKTAADFAAPPLTGFKKFASYAAPALLGFAGGMRGNPALGLEAAEKIQSDRTQAGQDAYKQYALGQEQEGARLKAAADLETEQGNLPLTREHLQAETANLQSESQERLTPKPTRDPSADKTVEVGDKTMQFNPATQRYDIEVGPAKAGTPKNMEAKTLQLPNGQQVAGKVDSQGNLLLSDNSPAPKGAKLYQQPNYGMMVLPTKTQTMLDENGVPTDYSWNPQTQKYDIKQGQSATGPYAHQEEQASAIVRSGDDLIKAVQANKGDLGTLNAWIKKKGLDTPIADPKLAGLQSQLRTFAALQPALHGFRSASALAEFNGIIGGVQNNPDAIIASIRSIQNTARQINPALQQGGAQADLTPPSEPNPGMKWQHKTTNGQTQWRQVPIQ